MKHRMHGLIMVSVVAVAGGWGLPVAANPGLLHKHGPRAVGIPAMLPGQSAAAAAVSTTTAPGVGAASGAATSAIAAVAPGVDGAAGGAIVLIGGADGTSVDPGLLPACRLPGPTGTAEGGPGGPNVFHKLNPGVIDGNPGLVDPGIAGPCPVDPGMIDPGMVLIDGVPPGFDPGSVGGVVDVGSVDGGDGGTVLIYAMGPGGPGAGGRHGGVAHRPMPAAMISAATSGGGGLDASAAATSATDGAGGGGRALAGGLPNRASGVRTDAVATIRHQGRTVAASAALAGNGAESSDGVIQAGGVADDNAAGAPHKGRPRLAGDPASGRAAVPPAATSAPRWRDRLRFAWPTPK